MSWFQIVCIDPNQAAEESVKPQEMEEKYPEQLEAISTKEFSRRGYNFQKHQVKRQFNTPELDS